MTACAALFGSLSGAGFFAAVLAMVAVSRCRAQPYLFVREEAVPDAVIASRMAVRVSATYVAAIFLAAINPRTEGLQGALQLACEIRDCL